MNEFADMVSEELRCSLANDKLVKFMLQCRCGEKLIIDFLIQKDLIRS